MRILYWPERRPDERLLTALDELHHMVEPGRDFEEAEGLARLGGWNAVLCDLDRPDQGRIRALRAAAPEAWLVVIGGAGFDAQRVGLLRAGADAVFVRPYEVRELSAKLDAMARRSVHAGPASGELRLDLLPSEHAVLLNGEKTRLSPREYAFIARLAARPGEVATVQDILEAVWGDAGEPGPELVHAYASRLRRKLERGRPWRLLQAVRGHGYRLQIEPQDDVTAARPPPK